MSKRNPLNDLNTPEQKQFVKVLEAFDGKHDLRTIFLHFLECSTIAMHQAVHQFVRDKQDDELEERYMNIISNYSKEDVHRMPELLAIVVNALDGGDKARYQDFLGTIYMVLNLKEAKKGQFFTPHTVARFMARMTFDATPIIKNGFCRLSDPTCGSGVLIIAYAEAMQAQGYNSQQQLYATGIDIAIPCVYMSYIQTTLLGIPAEIIHGDALTGKTFSIWQNINLAVNWWRFQTPKTGKQEEERAQESAPTNAEPQFLLF